MLGSQLGPYEILEEIGHGGMATVYRAYQPNMNRYVAIKVIHRNFTAKQEHIRRFEREARLVGPLDHPQILPIYEYNGTHNPPYIVMRYVDGGTLKQILSYGRLPLVDTSYLLRKLAGVLDYAHGQGVIHRDIKSSNIMLDQRSNIFLMDFGVARLIDNATDHTNLTQTGLVVGTPSYMSPEQVLDSKDVDHRSDIYSLGVLIYQVLCGELPFTADSSTALLFKHVNEPIPSIRVLEPELPEGVDRALQKALAKRPEDRYATASAFADDIEQFIDNPNTHPKTLFSYAHQCAEDIRARRLSIGKSIEKTAFDTESPMPVEASKLSELVAEPAAFRTKLRNVNPAFGLVIILILVGFALVLVSLFQQQPITQVELTQPESTVIASVSTPTQSAGGVFELTDTVMPVSVPETVIPTQTSSSTLTEISTLTPTSSATLTDTPVPTQASTAILTETPVPTQTPSVTLTETSVPTQTPTVTLTETPVPTWTPSATLTETSVPTPTLTLTETFIPPTQTLTATFTPQVAIGNNSGVRGIVTTGAGGANLRSGPSTNYPVVGLVMQGESLVIVGQYQNQAWYLVAWENQQVWVSASVVTIEGDLNGVANISPTSTPDPLQIAFTPVHYNSDWVVIERDFNGVRMVLVPAGCFMMGGAVYDNQQPIHTQCFNQPFWIDKYEVTQWQFQRLGGVQAESSGFLSGDRPVERITWFEARDFCHSRDSYLPTEAEWEYAARGVDNLEYPWGNEFILNNGIYSEYANPRWQTSSVGSRPTGISWVGALDMSGNVWEWTSSLYESYPYDVADGREADTGIFRVLRGGGWTNYVNTMAVLSTSYRDFSSPALHNRILGFRCARSFE